MEEKFIEDPLAANELLDDELPYYGALNELNKIQNVRNPREKLNSLLMMMSSLKTAIVDFHQSRVELASMDDELPILIYVVTQAKVENLLAEINLIEDFIQLDSQLDDEQKLLTNLSCTVQYVQKEWERDEKKYGKGLEK